MVAAVGSHVPVVTIAGLNAQAARNLNRLSAAAATDLTSVAHIQHQANQVNAARDHVNQETNLHNDVAAGVGANGTGLGNHVNTYA